ncbi:selenocysteine-specific translation elongation factor [Micromonospora sp. NPDC049044]|uniref:selenocysteine-specific translation elongation factor n=1 Tax=unclassified Micromonospora TaxID=2617518 RepID=UPI0033C221EF
MFVVATAGHVDHGKSTLVRALTGTEPDRLAEERRRGMTIDLGYAWTTLPSGAHLAFVDVPGHERFATNMLAGVGPVPAVLFVVAADEGWRTQSSEHLAALDLLGVRHGVLAVTRADLADPGPAMAQARERLAASRVGEVEAVAVDSVHGTGLPELRAALDRLTARLPAPDRAADVRLWIDRVFTIAGAGTVVTGTLPAGTLRVGDDMRLVPTGGRVQIRGIEVMKRGCDEIGGVARVAVNLRRIGRDAVRRGHALVTPDRWPAARVIDGRVSGGFAANEFPRELILHVGTAAVPVRVRPFDDDHVRLQLALPLPLRIGDVALLRDPGQKLLVARFLVLDVLPPQLGRRRGAADRAAELVHYRGVPDAAEEVGRRHLVRRTTLRAMGVTALPEPTVADWVADPQWWAQAGQRLRAAVERHADEHPADPGMPLETARQAIGLPARELVRALVAPPLRQHAGKLYGSRVAPTLPEPLRDAVRHIHEDLGRDPFHAPDADRISALGVDRGQLDVAAGAGQLLRVCEGIFLLPGADREAVRRLASLPQPFTASAARVALGTTRRVLVPLLELLEHRGLTERVTATEHRVRPGREST